MYSSLASPSDAVAVPVHQLRVGHELVEEDARGVGLGGGARRRRAEGDARAKDEQQDTAGRQQAGDPGTARCTSMTT